MALVSLLAATGLGGFSFVWCFGLAQAKLTCCCPKPGASLEEVTQVTEAPQANRTPCCESRRFETADTFRFQSELLEPAVPVVAVLPIAAPVPDHGHVYTKAVILTPAPPPLGRAPPPIPIYQKTSRFLC
ncbi:MAG: hypothetical protein IPK82_37105 [Polyangiaceae bacterium]|nr:hypothetical protein [Polyangiaceae bacterium]